MKIKLNIENSQFDMPINLEGVEKVVSFSLSFLKVKAKCLNVYLLDTESICDIHGEFFNDNSLTDCMSFPIDDNGLPPFSCDFLGEIFVSTKAAINYCDINNTDPHLEVARYIVHGILHLCGYEDLTENGKTKMETIQEEILFNINCQGISLVVN